MADETSVKRRPLAANLISEIAVVLAIIAVCNILFLVYIDATAARENPYIGVLAYMVAPALLVGAIIFFSIGLLWERRRRRHAAPGQTPRSPDIDLNNGHPRRLAIVSIAGAILFVAVSL